MKDFIFNLYSNDNFTVILTIILVILVIAFFIVLFFGKKDKKLQETQRLQKLNNAFKEETKEEKIEVPKEDIKEEKDSVVVVKPMDEPPFDDMPEVKTEPVKEEVPVVEPKVEDAPKVEEPIIKEVEIPKEEVSSKIPEPDNVEVKEFKVEEEPKEKDFHFDELSASLEKELTALENIKNEFNSIKVVKEERSETPLEEKEKQEKSAPQVFSSVFVKKEKIEDTAEFDLPALKDGKNDVTEKKEEKEFSFNDIEGESYNLNDK